MAQKNGIDWGKTEFVMGTRADLVPTPVTQPVFTRLCAECQTETVTETEYPSDVAVVCNVCAPDLLNQLTSTNAARLAVEMPAEAKARLIDEAHRRNIPVEEFLNMFLAWRTGRLMDASLDNHSEKKK